MSTGPQDPYGTPPSSGGPTPPPGDGGQGAPPPPPGGYGGPPPPPNYGGGGYGGPPPPPHYGGPGPGGGTQKNGLGVWALVLGILGFVCCGFFTAVPAIIVGQKSKEAAAQGLANNGGLGQAGFVLGWVGTVLSVLGIIWFFAMGGNAVITELNRV